jgi:endonuclease YncB( thermonuclease family)
VSKEALQSLVEDQIVRCEVQDTDRYERLITTCRVGDRDLGSAMVKWGHAVAYRRYSLAYVSDENNARIAERGIWAGSFVTPEDWRRGERLPKQRGFWSQVRAVFPR